MAKKNTANATGTDKKKLVVVLVRGLVGAPRPIIDTLRLLQLTRKNHCIIVEDSLTYRGMIDKVKDYATWGEIDEDTFQELVKQRGEEFQGRTQDGKEKYNYNFEEINGKKYKSYFRLNPPRKGFGRKGIKVAFKAGGALGYRGEKINDLVRRML